MNPILPERVKYLAERYATNTCTRSELNELLAYAGNDDGEGVLQKALQAHWEALQPETPLMPVDWEDMYAGIVKPAEADDSIQSLPRIPLYKRRWWAVAALLLATAGGMWLWNSRPWNTTSPELAAAKIAPGHSGAVLTLADGTQVVLDSAANGNVAQQANARVTKVNGQLIYRNEKGTPEAGDKPLYNTLSTPRGRHYQLQLPDGTIAWLNAASSIQYPAAFTGKERRVMVTGEVYLEVAANAHAPFIVTTPKEEITVLGTSFNVNAYANEAIERTTLLNGRIRLAVKGAAAGKELTPGQQAVCMPDGQLKIHETDAEQSIAWIKGLFWFNHATVPDVMRQLERWYDIEVTYEGTVPQHEFGGKLERSLPLADVLQLLEKSGVYCKVEGHRVTVLSDK